MLITTRLRGSIDEQESSKSGFAKPSSLPESVGLSFAGDVNQSLRLQASVSQLGIPGFTHPVTEFHLEDALELTQTVIGPKSK